MPSPNSAAATTPAGSSSAATGSGSRARRASGCSPPCRRERDAADARPAARPDSLPARHVAERRLRRAHDRLGVDVAGHADDHVGAGVLAAARRRAGRRASGARCCGACRSPAAPIAWAPIAGRSNSLKAVDSASSSSSMYSCSSTWRSRSSSASGKVPCCTMSPSICDEAPGVARQATHVERGVVLVGMGVDLGAEALGVEVDLLAVALARALEGHVLDEVADAVQARALVLAAGAHEHADAGAFEVRQRAWRRRARRWPGWRARYRRRARGQGVAWEMACGDCRLAQAGW